MAANLDTATNEAVTGYHLIDGPHIFAYKIDLRHALGFPEWSELPWTIEKAQEARSEMEAQHARETEEAKAKGLPVPKDLPAPPPPLDPEDEAAIMEHQQAVAEANERLKVAREKAAKRREEEEQIKADEALVATPPPQPDPNKRRPFGRKGEPTPAEQELMKKREEQKAETERLKTEKAAADAGKV